MASCSNSDKKTSGDTALQDEPLPRGVRQPRVIDLITPVNELPPRVELLMIEDRPWGSDPAQLDQLQEKLNNYLDYVLDGFLTQQYPDYVGRKIRIALQCVTEPKGPERGLIEAIERYLASTGIEFRLEVNQ